MMYAIPKINYLLTYLLIYLLTYLLSILEHIHYLITENVFVNEVVQSDSKQFDN